MWHNFLVALALLMILEGILPFLSPKGMRSIMRMVAEMDDHALRKAGLVSMLLGVVTLYLVN